MKIYPITNLENNNSAKNTSFKKGDGTLRQYLKSSKEEVVHGWLSTSAAVLLSMGLALLYCFERYILHTEKRDSNEIFNPGSDRR